MNMFFADRRLCLKNPDGLGGLLDTALKTGSEAVRAGTDVVNRRNTGSEKLLDILRKPAESLAAPDAFKGLPKTIADAVRHLDPAQMDQLKLVLDKFPSIGPGTLSNLLENGSALGDVAEFMSRFNIGNPREVLAKMSDLPVVREMAQWCLGLLQKPGNPLGKILGLLADTILPESIRPLIVQILRIVPAEQYKQALLIVMPYLPAAMVKSVVVELMSAMPPDEFVELMKKSGMTSFWEDIAIAILPNTFLKKKGLERLNEMDPEQIKRLAIAEIKKRPAEQIKAMSAGMVANVGDQYYKQARARITGFLS